MPLPDHLFTPARHAPPHSARRLCRLPIMQSNNKPNYTVDPESAQAQATAKPMVNHYEVPLHCYVTKVHLKDPNKPVSSRSAVELHAYANRTRAFDHTGREQNFLHAGQDFVASRIYFPAGAATVSAAQVWREADKAAESEGQPVVISNHLVCRLPVADRETCFGLIERFVRSQIVPMGLIAEAAIHRPSNRSPHVHFQISSRIWLPNMTFGQIIHEAWSMKTGRAWKEAWRTELASLP
jgi:hypothetical protein